MKIIAKAVPPGKFRGRRARRAAFYDRARTARMLTRVTQSIADGAIERAVLDSMIYGTGVVCASDDGIEHVDWREAFTEAASPRPAVSPGSTSAVL